MQTLKEKKNKNENVLYTYKSLSFFLINKRINTLKTVVYHEKKLKIVSDSLCHIFDCL
tara:strand:- start:1819 stop:1992 length:174 start_codon:yes stop_codon:yes gene_type:complete